MNDKKNGTNNEKILDNILRNLNMLEKALDRLKRKTGVMILNIRNRSSS